MIAASETLDRHLTAARRAPFVGVPALVADLRADPDLMRAARDRLKHYAAMEAANRLDGCALSKQGKTTLSTALAMANEPGVPVEG